MIYKTGEFYVCIECLSWLANGDATGLDYYHDADTANARLAAIQEGERVLLEEYGQLHIHDGESIALSMQPCDCCQTVLHGERWPIWSYTAAVGKTDHHEKYGTTKWTCPQFITEIIIDGKTPKHNSATGYGNKLPSQVRLRCADNRTRRVYAICQGNTSTAYILYKGERLILDVNTEHAIHDHQRECM